MAAATDYASFTVLHFGDDAQQHSEDFTEHAGAQKRFKAVAGQEGTSEAQLYGWLHGTGEPHLLRIWMRDEPRPRRRRRELVMAEPLVQAELW